jgi:hypothetical protein
MLTTNDVRIETPCGVDWSRMTRREANKRFCGACRKHVHDLSSMSEDEARALLTAPATEGLCVRYLADDRGRIAFRPDVPTSRLESRSLLAAALTMPLTLTACMGAAQPPMPVPRLVTEPSPLPAPTAEPTPAPSATVATPDPAARAPAPTASAPAPEPPSPPGPKGKPKTPSVAR